MTWLSYEIRRQRRLGWKSFQKTILTSTELENGELATRQSFAFVILKSGRDATREDVDDERGLFLPGVTPPPAPHKRPHAESVQVGVQIHTEEVDDTDK